MVAAAGLADPPGKQSESFVTEHTQIPTTQRSIQHKKGCYQLHAIATSVQDIHDSQAPENGSSSNEPGTITH